MYAPELGAAQLTRNELLRHSRAKLAFPEMAEGWGIQLRAAPYETPRTLRNDAYLRLQSCKQVQMAAMGCTEGGRTAPSQMFRFIASRGPPSASDPPVMGARGELGRSDRLAEAC